MKKGKEMVEDETRKVKEEERRWRIVLFLKKGKELGYRREETRK